MECRLELKKGSNDRPPPAEKRVFTKETQNPAKFRDDKRGLSYSDFHREITKKVDDVCPKRLENRLKSRIGRTASSGERDHLVKYKSYVPSYVKKSDKPEAKEVKAGGIGSGDVRISAKQIDNKHTRSSLSNTSISSSLWTDESSTDSSKGLVVSPFRRRINHPPLQYYLMSSKPGDCSKDLDPPLDNGDTSQRDTDATKRDDGKVHQSPRGTAFLGNQKKDTEAKSAPKTRTFLSPSKPDTPSSTTRVISRNLADDFNKKGDKLDEKIRNPRVHDMFGKEKPAAVFVPGIVSQKQMLGLSKFYDSKVLLAERVAEANRKGLAYGQRAVLDSDVGHFRREADGGSKPFLKRLNFLSAEKGRSSSAPRSRKSESSPSRSRTLDRRSTETTLTKLSSDQKPVRAVPERARSISPFRRLSFSIGKSSKHSNIEGSQTPPHFTPSRAGGLETRSTSSLSETSSLDSTTSAANRGRSSPLRRLLDPLIRPKSSHACRSPEPSSLKSSPLSSHQKHILSDGQPSSSTVQALFRVTSKNDQPLFTFAVDKEQSITAATIRKQMITEKEDCGHKYTFFTVQEVQKKNGKWMMNNSRKVQGQEYTSNIVAQMRVSGSASDDDLLTREYVLFASESQQQRPNELSAMVIKIPKTSDTVATTLEDVNTTVVLPSGIHSLPHKGGPSSLIQRWKSGGSCDCGGWDMGCNLRILTNESNLSPSTSDAFKLFCQGGLHDNNNQPFLSVTPYREGVYAVEYNTSLSLLQAFSTCIAVNEGRNTLKTAEPNTWRVDNNRACGEVSSLIQNERLKSCSGLIEGEAPAKYVSHPPVSPVGRV